MNESNGKFLVRLVQSLTHKQLLFLVWSVIAGGFVWLMLAYQKKMSRRNFRDEAPASKSKELVLVKKTDIEKKE